MHYEMGDTVCSVKYLFAEHAVGLVVVEPGIDLRPGDPG